MHKEQCTDRLILTAKCVTEKNQRQPKSFLSREGNDTLTWWNTLEKWEKHELSRYIQLADITDFMNQLNQKRMLPKDNIYLKHREHAEQYCTVLMIQTWAVRLSSNTQQFHLSSEWKFLQWEENERKGRRKSHSCSPLWLLGSNTSF